MLTTESTQQTTTCPYSIVLHTYTAHTNQWYIRSVGQRTFPFLCGKFRQNTPRMVVAAFGGLVKEAPNPMSLDTARHSLQKGIGNVQTPSCHAVWNARALNARKVYLHNVVQKTADWRDKATQYTYASDNRKIDRICFRCTVYPLCGWYRRFSAKCVHVRTSERALAIE